MKRSLPSTKAIEGFGAIAQSTRLAAVRQLLAVHPNTLPAGEIARRCAVPHNTMSTHLRILSRAGLIEVERDGRVMNYRANTKAFEQLVDFLTRECCKGRPDICGFHPAAALKEGEEAGLPIDAIVPAFNVLFLCTQNSARSIMAEALLERLGSGRFRAYSAGTEPANAPLPEVVRRLEILGYETSQLRCKAWSEFKGPNAPRMDFVVALCDVPHGQICQQLGNRLTAAWPLPDPARFSGSASERTTLLNELYAMIRRRVEAFVNLPLQSLDRAALKTRLDEIGDTTRLTP